MNVHEEIIITNPSEKIIALIQRMREHKRIKKEEMHDAKPMFTVHV